MRNKSIRLKITLWFTLILTVICVIIVASTFAIYRNVDDSYIKKSLAETVEEMAEYIETDKKLIAELEEGYIDALTDSDYYSDDVQLMIYSEEGEHVAGLFLLSELDEVEHSDSSIAQEVTIDGHKYYYYDAVIRVHRGEDYYIRGVVSAGDDFVSIVKNHLQIFIMIPVLIIIAFIGGYYLTGKFLKPVKEITETANEIRASGDLTKRIKTTGSGDELDELAGSVNGMFDKLENDFDAQRQFTSNASHELRTPVAVILAQCEYAFGKPEDKEVLLEAIASVQKQGYRMTKLIETLLIFTRIEQKTEKYPRERLEIKPLIQSLCEDYRLIADKNITIEEEYLADVRPFVNKELFGLMIGNLVQNAIRYGKENGHIKVTISESNSFARIVIADDGVGISPEDLPHIWDKFYRPDKSRSSKGMGLGLPLVKEIAGFHGGNVSVTSDVDIGSTFTVSLPLI